MRATTHYVPAFTRRDADGRQEAICGQFVAGAQIAVGQPTCWGCALWLHEVEHPTQRAEERARVLALITAETPYGEVING